MTTKQSTLDDFIYKANKKNLSINYIQVNHLGETIAEYSRLSEYTRLELYSVSKSVTAIGVGIALDEQLITLDEKLYESFLEYETKDTFGNVKKITVKDLLKMSCGFEKGHFFRDDLMRYETNNWIDYFFRQDFPNKPGEKFVYSNFNSYMLAALIEKKSGERFIDYLKPRLFEPLGISNPDWTLCPSGHCHAAFGLSLTIQEITKLGEMLLNEGRYKGNRILSSEFLQNATKNQFPENYPKYGYGYQFWINPDGESFRADGKLGQYIIVIPKKDLVITVLSLESQKFFDFLWSDLVMALEL